MDKGYAAKIKAARQADVGPWKRCRNKVRAFCNLRMASKDANVHGVPINSEKLVSAPEADATSCIAGLPIDKKQSLIAQVMAEEQLGESEDVQAMQMCTTALLRTGILEVGLSASLLASTVDPVLAQKTSELLQAHPDNLRDAFPVLEGTSLRTGKAMRIRRKAIHGGEGVVEREGVSVHIRPGLRAFMASQEGGLFLANAVKTLESSVKDGTLQTVSVDELNDIIHAEVTIDDIEDHTKPADIPDYPNLLHAAKAGDKRRHSELLSKVAVRDWDNMR